MRNANEGNLLSFEGVKRAYGKKQVLRGVSGSVARGRVVGLVGRNGEGKTTLLKIALDLLAPDEGRVSVCGRVPDGSGEIRQLAGYVPERPAFHGFMTFAEELKLRAGLFRNWDAAASAECAKRLGVDLNMRVSDANKGALAKFAWVCAASHRAELLLLDEPTSGLDALVREQVLGELVGRLQDEGKSVLIANHHAEEMGAILDEVWVLAGGTIAGVYDAEHLRRGTRLVKGRRGKGAIPSGARAVHVMEDGALAACAALDEEAARLVVESGAVENAEVSAMDFSGAMKLLLRMHGE